MVFPLLGKPPRNIEITLSQQRLAVGCMFLSLAGAWALRVGWAPGYLGRCDEVIPPLPHGLVLVDLLNGALAASWVPV